MRNKNIDLEKIAGALDISPSMYKYAVDRYLGIADYLETQGIKASFYPQGSFRTGTVVRPLKDGKETDFDIDVVCELSIQKDRTTPKAVKQGIGQTLQSSKVYADRLKPEDNRCWTLEYADFPGGIGLIMDVVPCVRESDQKILLLKKHHVPSQFAEQAVAITERMSSEEYQWLGSNPSGYGDWFDNINKPFLQYDLEEQRRRFFRENRALFDIAASVEEVPDFYLRSSLQRAIQLLKRHRDIFYSRSDRTNSLRPASVIIATLAAQIAQHTTITELGALLSYIVNGLHDYSELLQGKRPRNETYLAEKSYIKRQEKKWEILNPVNPEDNYADSWTDDTARMFFKWVDAAKADLGDPTPLYENKYITGLQTGLGMTFVNKTLNIPVGEKGTPNFSQPISQPTKPWGAR